MEYQKIPFPESIKFLAERYNISIQVEESKASSELFSSLYELHEIATNLYQENLFSSEHAKVLAYLKSRGLTEDIIKQFKIGFAKKSWDQLVKKCKGRGFTKSQIVQSGLFTNSDKGVFDRFRSRVMFPIFNPSGKVIAFGGRTYEIDDIAKYLNSPETPLYKKSDVFYGLNVSRDSIRKKGFAILVEGYMDYLKLYQNSIRNVIAISGTSFTNRHGIIINRITGKVVLLFDGDLAGANAVIKTGWVLLRSGIEPLIVRPPEGMDPDDWITNQGKEHITNKINSPIRYLDFHLEHRKATSLTGVDRRNYIVEVLKDIDAINDNIIKNEMIRTFSESMQEDVKGLIQTMKSQNIRTTYETETDNSTIEEELFTSKIEKAQLELIKLLSNEDKNIRDYAIENVSIDLFTNKSLKKLARYLLNEKLEVKSSSLIEYFIDIKERNFVAKILFESEKNILTEEIVSDCLKILKSDPIKQQIKDIRIQIRERELKGQDSEHELKKLTKLQNALNEI
jgi:DNA primase